MIFMNSALAWQNAPVKNTSNPCFLKLTTWLDVAANSATGILVIKAFVFLFVSLSETERRNQSHNAWSLNISIMFVKFVYACIWAICIRFTQVLICLMDGASKLGQCIKLFVFVTRTGFLVCRLPSTWEEYTVCQNCFKNIFYHSIILLILTLL